MVDDKDPEVLKSLSEEEIRRKAKLFTYDVEGKLEKITKKVKPDIFVPYIIKFYHDKNRKGFVAPHTYLQAIEANCAYYKDGYNEAMTQKIILNALGMNFKLESENPFFIWSISQSTDLFFQFIRRIQLEVQLTGFYKRYVVRYWKLFYANDFMPKIFDRFLSEYNISIEKWFLCSISIHTLFLDTIVASKNIKVPETLNLTYQDLTNYMAYSIYTVNDAKERYINERKKTPREFHFLIRTAFIERPILELSNNKIVAPIPELIYKHIGSGLTPMVEKVDSNGRCLGKSFQMYTKHILDCFKSTVKLYTDEELGVLSNGITSVNCDFLLAADSENILIECKAIDFRVRTLTKNAISNSASTTRVIDAIEQLSMTYNNIKCQKLCLEHVDLTKPFIHIVVTLDELPGYNSDWFFEEIMPSSDKQLSKDLIDFLNTQRPLVLSVESLEDLVVYLNSSNDTLVELCAEKEEKGYILTGDWSAFLQNKIQEIRKEDSVDELCFVDESFDQIFEKLGVSKERMNSQKNKD